MGRRRRAFFRSQVSSLRFPDSALIARNRLVHLFRPGVDAAGDVGDLGESVGPEILGDAQAPTAVVAQHKDRLVAGEFGQTLGNLSHGHVTAAWHGAERHLEGFAHVEQQRPGGLLAGRGRDVGFERMVHGAAKFGRRGQNATRLVPKIRR